MITKDYPFTKIDLDAERRLVLAKVYSLLIRLAEKAEKKPIDQELIGEKKTEESTPIQINSLTNEVNSAPLQEDIPP